MTADLALELCRSATLLALLLSGPVLLVALAVSLVMGLLQGMTQIQDQSLTFVPRLVAVSFVLLLLLPWGLSLLTEYSSDLFRGINGVISG